MEHALNLLDDKNDKNQKFGVDKVFHPLDVHFDTNSLSAWLSFYYQVHVKGAPETGPVEEPPKVLNLSLQVHF